MAKSDSKAPLGEGGRFAALKAKLERKGSSSPSGLAAFIGRKKLGKHKFQNLSTNARASGMSASVGNKK